MLLNLSKTYDFNREDDAYHVDYLFTKEKQEEVIAGDELFLILSVSVNNTASKTHRIKKPTSILYQSNEEIEKIIKTEAFTFSDQ